jgi:lipopolysaccharide export system permease protein
MVITLRLEDGSTHTVDAGLNRYRKMDFRFYDVRLDLASTLSTEKKNGIKSSTEMSLTELTTTLVNRGVKEEALRELAIELNKKLTVPFSCLVFALIGMPLGIRAHRSVRARGFTVGLFLVLAYYLLRLSGEALVETGRLSPILGTWTPNWIFAAAGILLFSLSAREVSFRRLFRRASAGPATAATEAGVASPGRKRPS